ncbi:TRAP transporter large permease [Aminobacter sp. MSH1]|uniref:TRAP transporter large permease n=1 Tax=Aminobacter sp. MSH1 TaxID=374606 RepID=UPI000D3B0FFC|nr:TRAP transporter large permease [Aminobacter sp. MSH1]
MLTIGLVGLIALVTLVCLGVPLAFAIGLVALVGNAAILGFQQTAIQLYQSTFNSTTEFIMMSIPLFILMGQLVALGGLGRDLYDCIYRWMAWIPGGLAVATILSCAAFGALTGISAAGIGTLAPIALPQMERYKYSRRLAAGSLASASTLAILIPPSVAFIVYGIWTETSIGALFLAGVVPGLILTAFFAIYVVIVTLINPSLAPRSVVPEGSKFAATIKVLPVFGIFILLMAGLYRGWFTPGEGAAVGTVAVAAVLFVMGRLTWTAIAEASRSAARLTVMIFAIVIVVQVFSRFLVLTEIPATLVGALTGSGLDPYVIMVIILFAYLLLGMILDTIGMMLLTLPFVFPVIVSLGFDPIWFGVVLVIMIEVGLLTPPVGLNCYMLNQLAPSFPLKDIFIGVMPFVGLCLILVGILLMFPGLATWLPSVVFTR